ncbi:MAG TPA: cell surface protein SprA [Candidatus Marinimicrobia bacterium]|nr:cell surface protein SprA [Candidatus Neomarinimicrobiota bacterium]
MLTINMEVDSLQKRIRFVSLLLWVTVVFPATGQGNPSIQNLPNSWHPQTPFIHNPYETDRPSLVMPYDSLSYSPRGLIRKPFLIIQSAVISKDWSTITLSGKLFGKLYTMPFAAPMDWYFEKQIKLNRELAFVKAIHDTTRSRSPQTQILQDRRGRGIEVIGVDMGNIGRVSLTARGNVTVKGNLVFQDQELIRSKLSETQNTHLEFDQTQRISVEGKIGDRVSINVDHDSERDFDWENNIRISYKGEEDDIVQTVDAGNVSLSLPGSQSLMGSASHQGLFGVKTVSKLGPMNITAIASIVNTEKKSQEYKGKSEAQTIKIQDHRYVENKYFFIHEWFRDGVVTQAGGSTVFVPPFYPLKDGLHQIGNIVVRNFELYQLDQTTNSETNPGTAFADLENPNESNDQTGNFKRLEQGQDYILSEDLGFIRLRQRANDEVLGCTFVLENRVTGDTLKTIGKGISGDSDQLMMKMLKPRKLTPNHPVWPLMFKNVYYLGTTNINKEGFELRIVNDRLPVPSHLDPQGNPYITQFGLDSLNESGIRTSDQKIDLANPNIISLVEGELFFPTFHPFAPDTVTGGNQAPGLKGSLGEGKMYFSTQRTQINNDSRFTIEVDYANQSATINLGFMIVEGSEQVYKGGIPLKKGVDYQVDYFSGTIVLSDDVDPNAEIKVIYDKHQLVTFDKKTIIGVRSQMDFGEKSFIGGTALYYNQSVVNEKVEVGYEPMRNFIWGFNGRFQKDFPKLTRTLDRLPLIETEQLSAFSFEGEFAQILPNPNPINNRATGDPNGVAFIDDFEGSKRTTSIPILRRFWRESSAPSDYKTGKSFTQRNRGKLNWFNPFVQVRTKDIWPNLSTSIQAQNETTDIMLLQFDHREHQFDVLQDSIWGGIITPFYSGDYDQTETKFFEMWVKGDGGKLTIDLGQISEDRDGNGILNTEDVPVGGLIGDGILDDEEDIGLDGCPDAFEDGWGFCLDPEGPSYSDYAAGGEQVLINTFSDVNPEDPNGDNWEYSEGSNDYSHINGTEKNALDAGRYPDTEDLDRTGFLDRTNDYFTKSFNLIDTTYFAGETKKDGIPTGWRLYRVPLSEFDQSDESQQREWNNINHLRLTISDVDKSAIIQIAKVELVGNQWQELGIAADSTEKFSKENADSIFAVSIINTDDNADYRPPEGVQGEFDRINQIRSKEQSLILKFTDLPGRASGAAMKTLISMSGDRARSYLSYEKMKMYVYGTSPWISNENTDVEMFMRFGFGENYYEVIQPVYDGWDEVKNRNAVNLDLEWLTRLKLQDSSSVKKYRETDIFMDSTDFKEYRFTDELGVETNKVIRIKGQPALNRTKYFVLGIRNLSETPITGEVWLDELRLSGVKKDKGISMRLQSRFNLGDILKTSIAFKRQDGDFHMLQRRLGSNKSNQSFNMNTGLNMDKFLPSSWGVRIPVTTTFSNSVSRPKYFPGQDILVNQSNAPDSILAKSNAMTLSISAAKSSKSDNKFVKYTLDRLNTRFSASRRSMSNEIQKEVLNESYQGQVSYALPFSRNNYFMPFKWVSSVPWIGEKLGKTHFYYSPSNFNASVNFNERLIQKTPRRGNKSPDVYNFGLNQSYALDYKITESINSKYSRAIKSNLNDYRGFMANALKNRESGIVTDITESFNSSFRPILLDWLKPTFNYSANYRWNKARDSSVDGANIGNQVRFSSGISLSPVKLVELVYKPSQGGRIPQRTRTVPPPRTQDSDFGKEKSGEDSEDRGRGRGRIVPEPQQKESPKETKEKKSKFAESNLLKKVHGWARKVNPINFSYTENVNKTGMGVIGDTPLGYRLGFNRDHGLDHSEQVGSNTGNWDHKRDFSVRSGLNLTRAMSLSFNYAQNVSSNRRGSGLEQRSMSRDYFSYGKHLENGLPFVGWSIRLTGLERNKFLKRFVRTLSLDHATNGKETRAWQFDQFSGPSIAFFNVDDFITDYKDNERTSRVNMNFSPLIGVTMALKKGVAVTMRHNRTLSREESANGGQKIFQDQSYLITANYMHRGGFTIPLPFFDNYKVNNQVNFTFNFDMNKNRTLQKAQEATKFAETAYSSSWKTGIRLTYTFSKTVSGSMIWEYRENDSKHTGKKIDRDFGFDVNLAIRG